MDITSPKPKAAKSGMQERQLWKLSCSESTPADFSPDVTGPLQPGYNLFKVRTPLHLPSDTISLLTSLRPSACTPSPAPKNSSSARSR